MADTSEPVVASVAQTLNDAGVPCVLWGNNVLSVHGIPSIVNSIDYIVPDALLEAGSGALAKMSNLVACTSQDQCPVSSKDRMTPPPAFHMHFTSSDITVGLFIQSRTLWFLPQIDEALAAPESINTTEIYVLATDQTILPPWRPGRGSGVFKDTQYPILVPRAHILLEAFMRLYARDAGSTIGAFGMAMIDYMDQYVVADGLVDPTQLPSPLDHFYSELTEDSKPVRQWTLDLKQALGMPLIAL